jgi:DNA-binding transcriptional MerR regulator
VTDEELMTIGRFAQLSGLSIHALRHYDDVGLLEPAVVDADTGYRRYRRGQIPRARLISSLRWIDLPIDEIRQVLGGQIASEEVLDRHRERLTRQANLLAARLADIDRFTEEGLPMPEVVTAGCVPVQIKIAVSDAAAAVEFYRAAFGMEYEVTRRTDEEEYSGFVFGEYGQPGFFLIHLIEDPTDFDRLGPSAFGLLVEDLDAVHKQAIAAGAAEAMPPRQAQGMPRSSAVKDPDDNIVWLYQG